ncbi:MAG: hypothetical protein KKC46_12350 [Proteobacteria bacterium]|nr:hypothetical protein [Pseudomonadota bacterium]
MKIYRNRSIIKFVLLFSILFFINGCSVGNKNIHRKYHAEQKVIAPKIVTLDKKPKWLLLAGIDIKKTRGDRIAILHKVDLPGWDFICENLGSNNDMLVVTPRSGNQVIYWKGNGSITNKVTNEKIFLPLPASEDPRTSKERKQFFNASF